MAANSQNRDLLVRQLAWQHEMGIDEILLDEPAPDEAVTMAALVPPSRRREPAAAQQPGRPPAAPAVSRQATPSLRRPRARQRQHRNPFRRSRRRHAGRH